MNRFNVCPAPGFPGEVPFRENILLPAVILRFFLACIDLGKNVGIDVFLTCFLMFLIRGVVIVNGGCWVRSVLY